MLLLFKRLKKIFLLILILLPLLILPKHAIAITMDFIDDNDIYFYNPQSTFEATGNDCVNAGVGTIDKLVGDNNMEKIWNYFLAKGLTTEQAAGALGNIANESGFSPARQQGGPSKWPKGAYGIIQWDFFRQELVEAMKVKLGQDFVNKWYVAEYGGSTTKEKGYIPDGMPADINDELLKFQLEYLFMELENKTISSSLYGNIVSKDYVQEVSDKSSNLTILKGQSTPQYASNFWLYEIEKPASILPSFGGTEVLAKNTRDSRGNRANEIYTELKDKYPNATDCNAPVKMNYDKAGLADEILSSKQITYINDSSREILTNIKNGINNGDDWPCGINIHILNVLSAIIRSGHTFNITSINRACKGLDPASSIKPDSKHYLGNGSAVDISMVNGHTFTKVNNRSGPWNNNDIIAAKTIYSITTDYLITAANTSKSGGRSMYGQLKSGNVGHLGNNVNSCTVPENVLPSSYNDKKIGLHADSCDHLHIAVPPDSDINLKFSK